jgi:hypothetical protein
MNWDRLIALTSMLLDAGILWILIMEYDFDKIVYEKELYKRKKKKLTFDSLNIGESK